MKKQISVFLSTLFIFSFLTVFFMQESALAATTNWTTARVLLSTDTAASSLTLTLDGSYSLHDSANNKINVTLQKKAYTIKKSGSNVAVYDGSSLLYSGSSVRFMQLSASGTNVSKIYNTRYSTTISYLGDMLFKQISGQLSVINHVYIEDYLIGVVPYEMNDYYPLEALKAQAVCARGYAITKIQSRNAYDYDLVDTSANQVYRGYTTSAPLCTQAVRETAKQILTFNGSVIESIFGDSNGGEIESPGNIWNSSSGGVAPTAYGYVRPDPYDLKDTGARKQSVTFGNSVNNNAQYPAIAYIKDLVYGKLAAGYFNENGGPLASGDINIISVSFTERIYGYGDPAMDHIHRKFTNAMCNHISAAKIKVAARVYQNDDQNPGSIIPYENEFDVIMDMQELLNRKIFTDTSTRAYYLTEDTDKNEFTITRGRWGHGVGLSQCGARQMAKEGFDYASIIAFYYPNTSLGPTQNIGDKVEDNGGTSPAQPEIGPTIATGTVTASTLNVRSGPGTNYSTLGSLSKGASVAITVQLYNSGWHQINYKGKIGYVSKDYIRIAASTPDPAPSTPDPAPSPPETLNGTVTASSLNVRSGPGTTYSSLGSLKKGATVPVTKKDYKAGWHQISFNGKTGYVSASYIKLSAGSSPQQPNPQDPGTSNPAPPDPQDPGTSNGNLNGTVTASTLKVRSGPGTTYSSLGSLKKGATVTITKKDYSKGWHQISYNGKTGYVSASYIKVGASSGNTPVAPGDSGSLKGTVSASTLKVRSGAGTSYSTLGSLKKGAVVTITKKNYSSGWHQISYNGKIGYVSAAYIKLS